MYDPTPIAVSRGLAGLFLVGVAVGVLIAIVAPVIWSLIRPMLHAISG